MQPVLPDASERLWKLLKLSGSAVGQSWDSAAELSIPEGHGIGKPEILFTKIEDEVIERELNALVPQPASPVAGIPAPPVAGVPAPPVAGVPAPLAAPPVKELITFDDFKKIDLRVARVLSAERVPKSEKLLKLQIAVGAERRQVVAGIAQHYAPEDLVGKTVIVVFNLQPAKLMGQESQGMILAASDDSGKLAILTPAVEIADGSVVK
jgi:methionyl-tRNA synthetase